MPFVNIDIDANHPVFAGHFPGKPIVPGVMLLDRAQQAIEQASGLRMQGLAMAKFLSAAVPGDALVLEHDGSEGAVRFTIRCGERVVASGRFVAQAPGQVPA
jgi:3-hydroxyacyl-[acyl-carrier-protein] dehydratase